MVRSNDGLNKLCHHCGCHGVSTQMTNQLFVSSLRN